MSAASPLRHHDLCFGCGQANLFGLQLELEPAAGGGVAGRFFLKQDHQGPSGFAHPGVIAAALEEAMSLALGAEPARFEVDFRGRAPVGGFVQVEALLEGGAAVATASGPEGPIASARGVAGAA